MEKGNPAPIGWHWFRFSHDRSKIVVLGPAMNLNPGNLDHPQMTQMGADVKTSPPQNICANLRFTRMHLDHSDWIPETDGSSLHRASP
ncbi:MAG: hypothetical protein U1F77_05200 [Kiritimatiellia bacterium]